jgi:hypothetical protein
MTQWSNGQAIFAQAVRLVRVALSNTSDEPRIMLSYEKYDEKKKDEKQKETHRNKENYNGWRSPGVNKEISKTTLTCYQCGKKGHVKNECWWNKSAYYKRTDEKKVSNPIIYENFIVDTGATISLVHKESDKFRVTEQTNTVPIMLKTIDGKCLHRRHLHSCAKNWCREKNSSRKWICG